MSLMEFLDIRDGALVPAYGRQVESIRCDWCGKPFGIEADVGGPEGEALPEARERREKKFGHE